MKKNHNSFKDSLRNITGVIAIAMLLTACKKDKALDNVAVVTGSGDITSKINEFRQVLGNQLNTTTGSVGGRREVNWDAVPADLLDKPLEGNFFNTPGNNVPASRQKGFVYAAGTNNFQVSNNGFQSINASTAAAFSAFSGTQTFSNVSVNLWDISFQIPGEATTATIKGFGMVFADVDVPNSTFVEFFNASGSVGKFFAPVHDASSNFSFLGVYFSKEKITRIRVGHDGTLTEGGADISEGGQKDFVVFDDFLFNEPVKE